MRLQNMQGVLEDLGIDTGRKVGEGSVKPESCRKGGGR